MNIKRTMDAAFLNEIANHPEVRPFLGGEGPLDLTDECSNPENIAIVWERGGWLLQKLMPGMYELHTLTLPAGRGREYFATAKAALRYVFTTSDALEIVTKCPDDNGGARMAASLVGFRERFRRVDAWAPGVGISYQALTVDDWFVRDRECLAAGRRFHEELEAAADGAFPPHPEDEAHDRAVGAAFLMIEAGQTGKGVGFYNRWAVLAGYLGISATAQNVVDIQTAIVEVHQGQMRVLKVRRPPE